MSFGRLERTPGPQPMSDINMTPLVDVMLVLVVIFILTAPLMASSIRLDLAGSVIHANAGLRADAAVPYGRVVEVMGAAHSAGLQRIGFIAEQPAAAR